MPFTDQEKAGVIDLLETQEDNIPLLLQIAKSITKNLIDIKSTKEALDFIFVHISDCFTLLNKRSITKEILFKYLHYRRVSVSSDFTKTLIINKVIKYWNKKKYENIPLETNRFEHHPIHETAISREKTSSEVKDESQFPTNLLARNFCEWFFDNYNKDQLLIQDFWPESRLLLRITANDGMDEHISEDSVSLVQNLLSVRQRFNFVFNPNTSLSGVQGRMDVHGLVLVLVCGTLHTDENCVGVFECTFGLLRDPFAENKWKTKTMQLILRSKGSPGLPSLMESDALKEVLLLPMHEGKLD